MSEPNGVVPISQSTATGVSPGDNQRPTTATVKAELPPTVKESESGPRPWLMPPASSVPLIGPLVYKSVSALTDGPMNRHRSAQSRVDIPVSVFISTPDEIQKLGRPRARVFLKMAAARRPTAASSSVGGS